MIIYQHTQNTRKIPVVHTYWSWTILDGVEKIMTIRCLVLLTRADRKGAHTTNDDIIRYFLCAWCWNNLDVTIRCLVFFRDLTEKEAEAAMDEFGQSDITSIRNKSAFLMSILK